MASFLERAILSVLNQQYPNLEYIIIDGGSTDGSVEIIKRYANHLAYWVSEKDAGQSDALNKGLQLCTGDIIAWLNSDDYYEPETLAKVDKYFSQLPANYGVLVGGCNMIYNYTNKKKNRIDTIIHKVVNLNTLTAYWESYFIPPQPSIFWRRKLLDEVGYLNNQYNYVMDYDLWLRFAKVTRFHCVSDLFSNYWVHEISKSGSEGGIGKFSTEWEIVVKKFILEQPINFIIIWHIKRMFHFVKIFLLDICSQLRFYSMAVLGFFVRILKRLTGIKRFAIFSHGE
jgi:glycosyltransferase involved in cell wall biosynthesis